MDTIAATRQRRDAGLDAVRGIAALVVVFYHCCLGFLPHRMVLPGATPAQIGSSFASHFYYGLLNGPAAVSLFFVLSGLVLTRSSFQKDSFRPLARTALKRYPRLAGPVLIACLLAWAIYGLGLNHNGRAAALTGSVWLPAFANGPSFGIVAALRQGLWRTLLHGDVSYNLSLWTMRFELVGSFVALGAAALMLAVARWSRWWALAIGIAAYVALKPSPLYLNCFLAGVTLGLLLARFRLPRVPLLAGLVLVAMGDYALGYLFPMGDYMWVRHLPHAVLSNVPAPILGSLLILFAVETCPPLRAALNHAAFRWLGRVSFPLYLVHHLVIISVGSLVRVWLDPWGVGPATAAAFAAVLLTSLAIATPFAWLDVSLMGVLDRLADAMLTRPGRAPAARLVQARDAGAALPALE